MCTARTATPSTPARPSSPRRSVRGAVGAGRPQLADDVTLKPLDPFYRIRFDDGERSTTAATPTMRARSRAPLARRRAGLRALHGRVERSTASASSSSAHGLRLVARHGRACRRSVLMRSWRSIRGMVEFDFRDPKLRIVFTFHPLLIGGNPFGGDLVYCLITFSSGAWACISRWAAPARWSRDWSTCWRNRCARALQCGGAAHRRRAGAPPACGWPTASARADIVVSNADSAWTYRHLSRPSSASAGPTASSTARATR